MSNRERQRRWRWRHPDLFVERRRERRRRARERAGNELADQFGIVTFDDSKLPFVEDEAAKITHPAAREAFLAAVAEAERPQELGIVDGDDDDPVP